MIITILTIIQIIIAVDTYEDELCIEHIYTWCLFHDPSSFFSHLVCTPCIFCLGHQYIHIHVSLHTAAPVTHFESLGLGGASLY